MHHKSHAQPKSDVGWHSDQLTGTVGGAWLCGLSELLLCTINDSMSFITVVHIKQWACLSPSLHFGYFIIPLPHSTLLSHISPASKLIDVLKTQILRFHAMFLYVYYVYLYVLNACRIVDLCREVFSYLKGVQPNPTPFPFSRVTINQLLLFYLSFIPPPPLAKLPPFLVRPKSSSVQITEEKHFVWSFSILH